MPKELLVPKEILDFYGELIRVQDKFSGDLLPVTLTEKQKDTFINEKAPLLNFTGFHPEKEKVKQALLEVCRVTAEYRPQVAGKLAGIQALADLEEELPKVLERFLWQDKSYISELVEQHRLDGNLTSFVFFNVLKPFIANYARNLEGQYDKNRWFERYCPVCGWKPSFAVISAGSHRRLLHCSLCETEWPFAGLECPHCSNTDHDTLKYFTVEDDEVYRVNVCERCKGYIKTIDEEKIITRENALITDIKTMHLDILAEREGYIKEVGISENKKTN